MKKGKSKGFTLAEILITLSIIGVVAAITIPSLLANVDDKVYSAKKRALHARLAQAIGQFDKLSGYGKITKAAVGTPGSAEYKAAEDNYAESFVLALSKVLKMNSFCVSTNLKSCGVSPSVKAMDGTTSVILYSGTTAKTLGDINSTLKNGEYNSSVEPAASYTDALPAAFTTANGEAVLVFYNPTCGTDPGQDHYAQNKMCVNFVYDINGLKAPNEVGKDVGFITVYSNKNAQTSGPIPAESDLADTYSYEDALLACQANDDTTRMPDVDELTSIFINKNFLGNTKAEAYWSGSVLSAGTTGKAWAVAYDDGSREQAERTEQYSVRCVRK